MADKKTILKTFGPFEIAKGGQYQYTSLVDIRTGKRLFGTYTKFKDATKWVKGKLKTKLKRFDSRIAALYKEIENIQVQQILWEELEQEVDKPVTLESLLESK